MASLVTCKGAHSSVASAARAIDADVVLVPADEHGRMWGAALRDELMGLSAEDRANVFAIVTTAGTTNAGVIDDLAGVAEVCAEFDIWMHVDGAYGGAGLAAPSVRDRYRGIEHADSFIVDPHKWLFAPFDCCALVYRDPNVGRAAHTQHAEYLDVLHSGDDSDGFEWNPSDFAHHLSRRARGLPFWFSLATHGTEAYRDAIETALDVTRQGARLDRRSRSPRADHGARAQHPAVPPHRVGPGRLPGVERPPARRGHGLRHADLVESTRWSCGCASSTR